MTRIELLLVKAAEESNEVGQRCTKALRFGLNETQKDQPLNNATRIMEEFADLLAVIEILQEENQLPCLEIDMEQRKARINKYMDYSHTLGILVEDDTTLD